MKKNKFDKWTAQIREIIEDKDELIAPLIIVGLVIGFGCLLFYDCYKHLVISLPFVEMIIVFSIIIFLFVELLCIGFARQEKFKFSDFLGLNLLFLMLSVFIGFGSYGFIQILLLIGYAIIIAIYYLITDINKVSITLMVVLGGCGFVFIKYLIYRIGIKRK